MFYKYFTIDNVNDNGNKDVKTTYKLNSNLFCLFLAMKDPPSLSTVAPLHCLVASMFTVARISTNVSPIRIQPEPLYNTVRYI